MTMPFVFDNVPGVARKRVMEERSLRPGKG